MSSGFGLRRINVKEGAGCFPSICADGTTTGAAGDIFLISMVVTFGTEGGDNAGMTVGKKDGTVNEDDTDVDVICCELSSLTVGTAPVVLMLCWVFMVVLFGIGLNHDYDVTSN